MTTDTMRDPRVRSVQFNDLLPLTGFEVAKELLISTPWLVASCLFAYKGYYLIALPLSFIFFLTGLRQVHDAYHYTLGIPRIAAEMVMFTLSVVMLGSMHALQLTHLQHHKHCMDDEDVEASSARMSGPQALLMGPLFPIRLHRKAYATGDRRRRIWITWELFTNVACFYIAFFVINVPFLKYHLLAMASGQCMTAFFAVWTVHHGCDGKSRIARTLRNQLKSFIAFDMFYHVEHHLFPKVPTCHLNRLAVRLDEAAPEISQMQVY